MKNILIACLLLSLIGCQGPNSDTQSETGAETPQLNNNLRSKKTPPKYEDLFKRGIDCKNSDGYSLRFDIPLDVQWEDGLKFWNRTNEYISTYRATVFDKDGKFYIGVSGHNEEKEGYTYAFGSYQQYPGTSVLQACYISMKGTSGSATLWYGAAGIVGNLQMHFSCNYRALPLDELFVQSACDGAIQTVEALIQTPKLDVNHVGADGLTALSCALKNKHTNVAKLLLEKTNVDPDALNVDGSSAPFWATNQEQFEAIFKYRKPDLAIQDKRGYTFLHRITPDYGWEVLWGIDYFDDFDINLEWLFSQMSSQDLKWVLDSVDKNGKTPFAAAAKMDRIAVGFRRCSGPSSDQTWQKSCMAKLKLIDFYLSRSEVNTSLGNAAAELTKNGNYPEMVSRLEKIVKAPGFDFHSNLDVLRTLTNLCQGGTNYGGDPYDKYGCQDILLWIFENGNFTSKEFMELSSGVQEICSSVKYRKLDRVLSFLNKKGRCY